MLELKEKIVDAFFNEYGEENYIIYNQDPGKSFMNFLNNERGITLVKAIEFTIEYLKRASDKE